MVGFLEVHGHQANLLKLRLEYFFMDFIHLMILLGCTSMLHWSIVYKVATLQMVVETAGLG